MKKLLFLFLLISQAALAQEVNRYMVYFSDKEGSAYSIDRPEEFLTERALERRSMQQIAVVEQDLPVNSHYIQQMEATGINVYYRSRWLNAVMVEDTDEKVRALSSLPFVQTIVYLAPGGKLSARIGTRTHYPMEVPQTQHELLEITYLHEKGYTGNGKLIAVLDDGFLGVDVSTKFDHLFRNQQIVQHWDFVGNSADVYRYDDHGTKSLSTIAVVDSGTFIGTAPDAQFLLAVTEDVANEFVIEEYNWLIASEWADSLGADIISSSLGYATFDDPTMNHTHQQLDGITTVAARAAGWATARGILVVASSGNSRGKPWEKIMTPADADNILAVGAINADGTLASFSSGGPTADGRTKPEVVAQGVSTVVVGSSGEYYLNNGTSFAAPQIAGMAAGVWQAFPTLTNLQLREAILRSGDRYATPDNDYGNGLPRVSKIFSGIINAVPDAAFHTELAIFPNPLQVQQRVLLINAKSPSMHLLQVQVVDLAGRVLTNQRLLPRSSGAWELTVEELPAGLYFVLIESEIGISKHKFIRL